MDFDSCDVIAESGQGALHDPADLSGQSFVTFDVMVGIYLDLQGVHLTGAYLGHIGADIRACDLLFPRCACPTSLLGFFYVFEPGSLLCLCWLFALRNIGPVFGLKYVSLYMFGL